MKHTFLILLLLPLTASSPVLNQGEMSPVNFDVITLGDGIYACINTFGGKAICNAGIVDNGESTIIFDTFLSPEAAEELIQLVSRLKLSPIRFVVNSHCHNDHVRGNQSFSPEVKILSTRRTAELMERDEPVSIAAEKIYGPVQYAYFDSLRGAYKGDTTAREYQIIKMNRAYFEELSKSHERIRSRIPGTFVAKEHSLDGSRRRVRLQEKGGGVCVRQGGVGRGRQIVASSLKDNISPRRSGFSLSNPLVNSSACGPIRWPSNTPTVSALPLNLKSNRRGCMLTDRWLRLSTPACSGAGSLRNPGVSCGMPIA